MSHGKARWERKSRKRREVPIQICVIFVICLIFSEEEENNGEGGDEYEEEDRKEKPRKKKKGKLEAAGNRLRTLF